MAIERIQYDERVLLSPNHSVMREQVRNVVVETFYRAQVLPVDRYDLSTLHELEHGLRRELQVHAEGTATFSLLPGEGEPVAEYSTVQNGHFESYNGPQHFQLPDQGSIIYVITRPPLSPNFVLSDVIIFRPGPSPLPKKRP